MSLTAQGDARIPAQRPWLLVCAAPAEGRAVSLALDPARFSSPDSTPVRWRSVPLHEQFDLLVTGVGKANASAGVARALDPSRHVGVINLGVCGALPRSKLNLLDTVLATASVYADEGVQTPDRFITMGECGFPPAMGVPTPTTARADPMSVPCDPRLVKSLARVSQKHGVIATVSSCSGRNRSALLVTARTGAIAEAMEGAAVGFTVTRLAAEHSTPLMFAELRIVSNTTGTRSRQRWDLPGALEKLTCVTSDLARLLVATPPR